MVVMSAFNPLSPRLPDSRNRPQLPATTCPPRLPPPLMPLPHQVICDSYADCARINGGHTRNSCNSKTVSNGTTTVTMKMCACMMYAGLTNTSCVLDAKCVTGPKACLVRGPGNQAPARSSLGVSSSVCLTLFLFQLLSSSYSLSLSLPWSRRWSLTHSDFTLYVSHSVSSLCLTRRWLLQPCACNRAVDISDDSSVRIRHDSRAGIYLVLCKAERREHYDDIYGGRYSAERHVRSDFLPSKLILTLQSPFSSQHCVASA